jgi:hypothetical protein
MHSSSVPLAHHHDAQPQRGRGTLRCTHDSLSAAVTRVAQQVESINAERCAPTPGQRSERTELATGSMVATAWVAGVPDTARGLVLSPLWERKGFAAEAWFLASPAIRKALVGTRHGVHYEPLAPNVCAVPRLPVRVGARVEGPKLLRQGRGRANSCRGSRTRRGGGGGMDGAHCPAIDGPLRVFRDWGERSDDGPGDATTVRPEGTADDPFWSAYETAAEAGEAALKMALAGDVVRVVVTEEDIDALGGNYEPLHFDELCVRTIRSHKEVISGARHVLIAIPQCIRGRLADTWVPRFLFVGGDEHAAHVRGTWLVNAVTAHGPRGTREVGRHVVYLQSRAEASCGHWLATEVGISDLSEDGDFEFCDEAPVPGLCLVALTRTV